MGRSALSSRALRPPPDSPRGWRRKGSSIPNRDKVGKLTRQQAVREIAEVKMQDLNAIDIEGAMLQVEGTARSMGILIEE